jgi:hypothetical protein
MAEQYIFNVDQGSTFNEAVIYKQADGTPVDLTGWAARMQVRRNIADAATLLSLTDGDGLTITAVDGRIDIEITATQTAAIMAGTCFYDLEIYSGAVVRRLIEGRMIFRAEVTR